MNWPFKGVLEWLHGGRGLLRGSFGDEGRDLAWRAEWASSVKIFLKPGFRHVENWKSRYLDFKKIDDLESGFHFNHDTG